MGNIFSFNGLSFKKLLAVVQKDINAKQNIIKGTPGNILTFNSSGELTELDRNSIKGADGVSVLSIEQIASSTADGGTNTFRITLSNGKTADFSVKNGSKGSTGPAGANATTTAVATTTANGLMSPAMVTKLNGVEAGANKCTEMSDATIESIFNSVFS